MAASQAQGLTASARFDLLWGSLAEVLGTAASAILLRRAAKRAMGKAPGLDRLVIERGTIGYSYVVPDAWQERGASEPEAALCELIRELQPLLTELTGAVVIHHLERVRGLRGLGLVVRSEKEEEP
jgi:hypothetical protein